jgi:hypothetical protein
MYTHPGSGEFLIYASGLIIPGGEKPQLPPDMYFKVIQKYSKEYDEIMGRKVKMSSS